MIGTEKAKLRKKALSVLKQISDKEKASSNIVVASHVEFFISNSFSDKSLSIAVFKSFTDEIPTAMLIDKLQKKHNLALPRVDHDNIMRFYAIKDHQELTMWDLNVIIVPALLLDKLGRRLGRGRGYYDKYLAKINQCTSKPYLIGLAFDDQIIEEVPSLTHDIKMDAICTPSLGVFTINRLQYD